VTHSGDSIEARALLRHTLATLGYRAAKAIDAPAAFAEFRVAPGTRAPGEILAHVGDLLDWALWMARGEHRWRDSAPLPWDEERARFVAALRSLDAELAGAAPIRCAAEKLFQGPIADALTHVGQLAMLRRLAGVPMRGENYARARIVVGELAPGTGAPRVEFD
jgi:hypothetical protein